MEGLGGDSFKSHLRVCVYRNCSSAETISDIIRVMEEDYSRNGSVIARLTGRAKF